MLNFHRRTEVLFGVLFGAWLGGLYAYVTQAVNWLAMPGIPLAAPGGSLAGYLGQYMVMGALLGLVSALPENRLVGVLLGGLAAALSSAAFSLYHEWGFDTFGSVLITTLTTFMPMAVLLMPLALVIRLGIDAQHPDPGRPYLWPRRYLMPLLLTLVAVAAGSLSLHAPNIRDAFRYTDQMIRDSKQVNRAADLPVPLQEVKDFTRQAHGPYTLAWSDRVETFMGPRPASNELEQFLIIARFEQGLSFACVFSPNRPAPNCTNY